MSHRIVVTGHSGLRKLEITRALASFIKRIEPGVEIEIIDLEGSLKENKPKFHGRFLYASDPHLRYQTWSEELRFAAGSWRNLTTKPKYTFLLLHLSYHSESQFFFPLEWSFPKDVSVAESRIRRLWKQLLKVAPDWLVQSALILQAGHYIPREAVKHTREWLDKGVDHLQNKALVSEYPLIDFLLRDFRPTKVINLYDNVHSIRRRLSSGYHFRLNELLRWRNIELAMSDIIASQCIPDSQREKDVRFLGTKTLGQYSESHSNKKRYPFEASLAVAVNHPKRLLYNLIERPQIPRVYLSFQISSPRREASGEMMRQINHFRRYMSAHFSAFDPLTIDELPLLAAFSDWLGRDCLDGTEQESLCENVCGSIL